MTRIELIKDVAKKCGLPQKQVKPIIEAIFEQIKNTLSQGSYVHIKGFGRWDVRHKKERIGRNPVTGELALIKKRIVPRFISSKFLKAAVNNGGNCG